MSLTGIGHSPKSTAAVNHLAQLPINVCFDDDPEADEIFLCAVTKTTNLEDLATLAEQSLRAF